MSPGLYCGSLVPIAKECSLQSVESLEGVWRQVEALRQQDTCIHFVQGMWCSSYVSLGQSSHTYYPNLELLGPGETVFPELNAKMA